MSTPEHFRFFYPYEDKVIAFVPVKDRNTIEIKIYNMEEVLKTLERGKDIFPKEGGVLYEFWGERGDWFKKLQYKYCGYFNVVYISNCGMRVFSAPELSSTFAASKGALKAIKAYLDNAARNMTWICTGNERSPVIHIAKQLGFEQLTTIINPNSGNKITLMIRYHDKRLIRDNKTFVFEDKLYNDWFFQNGLP